MQKSITKKLFLLLVVLVSVISTILGIESINNSNRVIQREVGKLNHQVLLEVAKNISILLENIEDMGKNVSSDNQLIKILSQNSPMNKMSRSELEKNTRYVEGLLNDQAWKYGRYNIKPEFYVVGEEGIHFSTYSKTKYNLEDIREENWYQEIIKADGKGLLISSIDDPSGIGPYRNIFRMGRVIKDLISGETLGVLIIDVSEKMLFDCYSQLLEQEININITDEKGMIVSSKDKSIIGLNYRERIDTGEIQLSTENYTLLLRDEHEYMRLETQIEGYGWTIIEEIPIDIVKQPINDLTQQFFYTFMIILFAYILVIYIISRWVTKPIIKIKEEMVTVMKGNLHTEVIVDRADEIGQLQASFKEMVEWLNDAIVEVKEKEKQKMVAELSFLQAQINPHFLYNTLSGIRFLVSMNKNDIAEEMIFRFTKLMRDILPKANELISLEQEIHILENYVDLQKLRYPEGFEVKFEIDDNIKQMKVPCLILQPVIENAIFYSMENEKQKGLIKIRGYMVEGYIKIEISDNGKGMSEDKLWSAFHSKESTNRVGLQNVHERIVLNYGQEYGLQIESVEGVGTTVIFVLPNLED